MAKRKSPNVRFKRHSNIGAADARDDRGFLDDCFVDTGAIDILRNVMSPQCVILGRTGAGKTALIEQLKLKEKRVIEIEPEALSLAYIENSTILKFFIELGVNLDPFYRLLWRHVLTVEILRCHYNIVDGATNDSALMRMRESIKRNRAKEEALEYVLEYGDKFWEEFHTRIKEVTSKVEQELSASIAGGLQAAVPGGFAAEFRLGKDSAKTLTAEQRALVQHQGQQVVEKVQIHKLITMTKTLEEDILVDAQKRYYITIDRLDEGWVDDLFRYQLIKALLDTALEFNRRITNAKIIVAIREDLIERVFQHTRGPGHQEEKFRSMYIPLTWNERQLEELLLKRVAKLKASYAGDGLNTDPPTIGDIMPAAIRKGKGFKQPTLQYILARTLMRPRDVIIFFNECISHVDIFAGHVTQAIIFEAEERYSELRLRALSDEWSGHYKTLYQMAFFLYQYPTRFRLAEINREKLQEFLLKYLAENESRSDCAIYQAVYEHLFSDNSADLDETISSLLEIAYRVGIIGIVIDSKRIRWCEFGDKLPLKDDLAAATFAIHPAFWKVLKVKEP